MSVTLLNSASTVNALAYLATSGLMNGEVAEVANYAAQGDLGGGLFTWVTNSVTIPDKGICLCPAANFVSVTSTLIATGDGSTVTFSGNMAHTPIQPGSLSVKAGSVTGSDQGDGTVNSYGVISGTGISGSIQYPGGNGAWSITFSSPPAAGQNILASYVYMTNGRWIRQFTGPIQDVFFGVIANYNGTTGNDDTAALQAAINYCAINAENRGSAGIWWKPLLLPPTGGARYITTSLNATISTNSNAVGHFKIIGQNSEIVGKLSSAHPILDLSGNNYCEIDELTVSSAGGSESVSILLAATSFNAQGGVGSTFNRLTVNLGLAIINSDLVTIEESTISNSISWALLALTDNPTGLVSAYQTINISGPNTSLMAIYGGQITSSCPTTGVIWHDINGTLTFHGVYVAPTGANGTRPCILRIGNTSPTSKQLVAAFRMENQSLQNGLPAFQTYGTSGQVIELAVAGDFVLHSSDYCFDFQPANATIQQCDLDGMLIASAAAIFTSGSKLTNLIGAARFNCPVAAGPLASGSAGLMLHGATPANAAAFIAQNPTLPNLNFNDRDGTWYQPITSLKYNPAAGSATPLFDTAIFVSLQTNQPNYTGGSGLVQLWTQTIPANVFVTPPGIPNNNGSIRSSILPKILILGSVSSPALANGQIQFQVVQGSSIWNFIASNIPAYSSTANLIEIEFHICLNAGFQYVKISVGGIAYLAQALSTSIVFTSPITMNISVNNAGNNPYHFQRYEGSI